MPNGQHSGQDGVHRPGPPKETCHYRRGQVLSPPNGYQHGAAAAAAQAACNAGRLKVGDNVPVGYKHESQAW